MGKTRDTMFHLRLSKGELRDIKRLAKEARLKPSEYVRLVLRTILPGGSISFTVAKPEDAQ